METRAHGAYRRTDQARKVLDGKVAIEAKDHDDPMIRGESAEGALEAVALIDGPMGVMRGNRLSRVSQVVVASVSPSSEAVAARVDEDPPEPGVEPLGIAEPMVVAPCSDERIVGRIFRLLCVAKDEAGKPIALVEAPFEQPLEGLPPSSLDVDREDLRFVGQRCLRRGMCPFPKPTHQGSETFILRRTSSAA